MNKTNLLIDTGIFAAFLVAMEPRFSGVAVHEWLSLALAGTIIVHLLLHWKWITSVLIRFFKKLWHSSRLKFVVDALLFTAFVGVMASGIVISRSVVPALGLQFGLGENGWRQLHALTADASMWLLGVHFALSWSWIVSAVNRYMLAPITGMFHRAAAPAVAASTDEN
jgi:hypothetical protein